MTAVILGMAVAGVGTYCYMRGMRGIAAFCGAIYIIICLAVVL